MMASSSSSLAPSPTSPTLATAAQPSRASLLSISTTITFADISLANGDNNHRGNNEDDDNNGGDDTQLFEYGELHALCAALFDDDGRTFAALLSHRQPQLHPADCYHYTPAHAMRLLTKRMRLEGEFPPMRPARIEDLEGFEACVCALLALGADARRPDAVGYAPATGMAIHAVIHMHTVSANPAHATNRVLHALLQKRMCGGCAVEAARFWTQAALYTLDRPVPQTLLRLRSLVAASAASGCEARPTVHMLFHPYRQRRLVLLLETGLLRRGSILSDDNSRLRMFNNNNNKPADDEDEEALSIFRVLERDVRRVAPTPAEANARENNEGATTTVLHFVAASGARSVHFAPFHAAMISQGLVALLEAGADPWAIDRRGRTPLDVWRARWHVRDWGGASAVHDVLESAMADVRARQLAVAMAMHPRLGAQSLLGLLDPSLLQTRLATTRACVPPVVARSPRALHAERLYATLRARFGFVPPLREANHFREHVHLFQDCIQQPPAHAYRPETLFRFCLYDALHEHAGELCRLLRRLHVVREKAGLLLLPAKAAMRDRMRREAVRIMRQRLVRRGRLARRGAPCYNSLPE